MSNVKKHITLAAYIRSFRSDNSKWSRLSQTTDRKKERKRAREANEKKDMIDFEIVLFSAARVERRQKVMGFQYDFRHLIISIKWSLRCFS